jgi:hypothetical protein
MIEWLKEKGAGMPPLLWVNDVLEGLGWTFIETLLCEDGGEVIDMETVAQASGHLRVLYGSDLTVAGIVSRHGTVKYSDSDDLCACAVASDLDNFVAILGFSSVSVMHMD